MPLGEKVSTYSVSEGKHKLRKVPSRGAQVSICQGRSDALVCCELKTLSPVENCPYACSYCFLQFYLTDGETKVMADIGVLQEELQRLSFEERGKVHRVTTGELSDSLALESMTHHARELIPFVERLPNIFLELKTKSDYVQPLLRFSPKKTIVSFSMSPEEIVEREELRAASLARRIQAIRLLQQAGYGIALHFDPMLCFPGWEKAYRELVGAITSEVSGEGVLYVSLGSLRFQPEVVRSLYVQSPSSLVLTQELFRAPDGKWRYPLYLRKKLYRYLLAELKKSWKDLLAYLCMESREAWEGVLDPIPESAEQLEAVLTSRLVAWAER